MKSKVKEADFFQLCLFFFDRGLKVINKIIVNLLSLFYFTLLVSIAFVTCRNSGLFYPTPLLSLKHHGISIQCEILQAFLVYSRQNSVNCGLQY